MKHYSTLCAAAIDMVDLVINGELIEALSRYYHPSAWLPKRETIATYVKDERGQQVLNTLSCNKCLYVEQAVNMGVGNQTTCITWKYSGTVGSALKSSFTVTSIQHWHNGKVLYEEFLHAN